MAARKGRKKAKSKRGTPLPPPIPSVWDEFKVIYPIVKRMAKERRIAEEAARLVRETSEPGPDVRLMANYYNDD